MTHQPGRERRASPRKSMALGLHLYAYGMLVASGITVDMSEHGMLLRIQQAYCDDELDPGKHLDVMLDEAGQTPNGQWLPIRVVRNCEHGIAVSFVGVG